MYLLQEERIRYDFHLNENIIVMLSIEAKRLIRVEVHSIINHFFTADCVCLRFTVAFQYTVEN